MKARTIFLDIPGVVVGGGSELLAALPGVHVYMYIGCYSTSSFAGKDKKGSFKLHRGDKNTCQAMAVLERKAFDDVLCKLVQKMMMLKEWLPPCHDSLDKFYTLCGLTIDSNFTCVLEWKSLEV